MFPAEETTAFPTIGVFGQFLTRPVTDAFAGVAPLTTAAPACRPARPPAVVPAVLPARPPARRPRAKSRAVVPLPPLGALFAGADGAAAEFLALLRLEWPTAYPPTAARGRERRHRGDDRPHPAPRGCPRARKAVVHRFSPATPAPSYEWTSGPIKTWAGSCEAAALSALHQT